MLSSPLQASALTCCVLHACVLLGDGAACAVDVDDPLNNLDLGINAGRYIDFKDVLYIAPQVNLGMLLNDPMLGVSIGVGTRF